MRTNKDNNFDNVRMALSLIVFFYHALTLSGQNQLLEYSSLFDAYFAVKGFFAVSGYLIFQSYLNRVSFFDYFEKRMRRIYPAYLFAIFFCLIIGMLVSKLNLIDFFSSIETIKYILSNLFFLNFIQPNLPQVFESNPLPAINGSLWTIKIEIILYFLVPIIAYLFKRINPLFTYFLILFFGSFWVLYFEKISALRFGVEFARQFPAQLPYFAFGSLVAAIPQIIFWLPVIAIFGVFGLFLIDNYLFRLFVEPVCYSALILFACTLSRVKFNVRQFGDLSYGIYLFHFPIIQLFINLGLYRFNPYLGLLVSFVVTIILSYISWHFIEKHFLKRNSYYLKKCNE